MKFLKHPATIITGIILALVAGFFAGKSDWFNNLLASNTGNNGNGNNGTGNNGTGSGNGETGNGNGDLPVDQNTVLRAGNNAPYTIRVWVGAAVPYTYMGCTYGKPYYTMFQGSRVKILTKLSCP